MWSISASLVFLEIVFQIDKLSVHASAPRRVGTDIGEPFAGLADIVLVDKPLVSLIDLPGVFKLLLGWFRYIVQYVFVQFVVYLYVKLIYKGLSQKPAVAIAVVLSLEDEMLMVAVIMLAALFLAQSSSPSSHSIAPFHFPKRYF